MKIKSLIQKCWRKGGCPFNSNNSPRYMKCESEDYSVEACKKDHQKEWEKPEASKTEEHKSDEPIQSKVEQFKAQRRKQALFEFAIRAVRDFTESDKMLIHIGQLKQDLGYNKYVCQGGRKNFEDWMRENYQYGKIEYDSEEK